MNMKTPSDIFCLKFHASWDFKKIDGKDYTFIISFIF